MRKNILLILSDDHAQWASGCYGNNELNTPNIDKLANTGIQMMNAFAPTPVCSPARANLFTGKIASQHGIHDYLTQECPPPDKNEWLDGNEILPTILKENGYQTGLVGKWHLGNDKNPHPSFDSWFGLSGDYPWEHDDEFRFINNGKDVTLSGYKTNIITQKAIEFLDSTNEDSPFFLYVGLTATHSPWAGHPERLVEKYRGSTFDDIPADEEYSFGIQSLESTNDTRNDRGEALAQYYASVEHHDEAIGNIIDDLETKGLLESTLIIYSSDHGLNTGHHGIWGKGNGTLPLNMLDESIRVPLIFNHPAMFASPQKRNEFVDHCDLFQTIIEYSESILKDTSIELPGKSYLTGLNNPDEFPDWRDAQFCEYGDVRMIRTTQYKLIKRGLANQIELFDMHNDPREEKNIAKIGKYQSIISQLSIQIDQFFEKYQDPMNSGLNVLNLPKQNFTEAWRS